MITVTFVRHGESEDNPKPIWAGWKDAPLSELGQRQAEVIGKAYASTRLTRVYASPLKRAHSTGLAIHNHQSDPKPPFVVSPHLREQNFGVAEGNQWVLRMPPGSTREELYAQNIYPIITSRTEKFPEGESPEDLARRCEQGVRECILPHVHGGDDTHVVLASHGLCISELITALLRLDPQADKDVNYTGLLNTAWTRATVRIRDNTHSGPVDPNNPPPLEVKVTHVNQHDHLKDVVHLKAPAVDAAEDESAAEARAFFGGGLKESNVGGGEQANL